MFLSYSALQRYGKQFLSLDSKLHREFLQHLLCIAVDDESYGLLCGNTESWSSDILLVVASCSKMALSLCTSI